MQNWTDAQLLREYATAHSEAAFREIVRRYADTVYSAAMRQTGNEAQASDVAQTVFVDLARKAASLKANTVLIGWLHRGARLASLELLRREQRRIHREQQAMELHESSQEVEGDWSAIRPILDEAIANLGDEDRNALLLRFFKNESLSSVGATLGVSEDAAQKRVSRALEKLRDFLVERGIKTTVAALSVTLAANTIQSAPTGLAVLLSSGALTKAAIGTGTSTTSFLTLSNMKIAMLFVALVAGLAVVMISNRDVERRLRAAQATIQQQTDELAGLTSAREQLAYLSNELQRVRGETREVLRLRAEVTALRKNLASSTRSAESDPEVSAPVTAQENAQIHLNAKLISLPTRLAPSESPGDLLTAPYLKTYLDGLERVKSGEIDGSPVITTRELQVVTLSGRQAQLQGSLYEATNGGVGFTLDIAAHCDTNSSQITFDLLSTYLIKTFPAGVGTRDPGSFVIAGPQFTKPSLAPGPGIALVFLTNSTVLWDGQTLLLTRRLPDELQPKRGAETEPESLMIFVTPTIIDAAGNRLSASDDSQNTQTDIN